MTTPLPSVLRAALYRRAVACAWLTLCARQHRYQAFTLDTLENAIATELEGFYLRLQQRVMVIMRFAVQNDYIDSNPASDMAGALSTTKARHYPALSSSRFPEFLARLAAYRGRIMTRIAVELSLLTFVRSSELRFARWDEFDFDKSLWRVPAKREEIKGVRYSYRVVMPLIG